MPVPDDMAQQMRDWLDLETFQVVLYAVDKRDKSMNGKVRRSLAREAVAAAVRRLESRDSELKRAERAIDQFWAKRGVRYVETAWEYMDALPLGKRRELSKLYEHLTNVEALYHRVRSLLGVVR